MLYGSLNQGQPQEPGSEPTPLEALLTFRHGDLHEYIPRELNRPGVTQSALAARMNVSPAWLSQWLKTNGYRRATRWERK
jgi:hypothetical protein